MGEVDVDRFKEMCRVAGGEFYVWDGDAVCIGVRSDRIYRDIQMLRRRARETLDELIPKLHDSFEDLAVVICSRVKSMSSIAEKIERKNRDPRTFTDIAGVRIITPPELFPDVLDRLLKNEDIELVEVVDYIKEPTSLGYRSLHLVVKYKGFPVEIQLHSGSTNAYAYLCHRIYKTGLEGEVTETYRRIVEDLRKTIEEEMQQKLPLIPIRVTVRR